MDDVVADERPKSISRVFAARGDARPHSSPADLRARILSEAHSIGALTGFTLNAPEPLLETALRGYVLQQTASHPRSLPE